MLLWPLLFLQIEQMRDSFQFSYYLLNLFSLFVQNSLCFIFSATSAHFLASSNELSNTILEQKGSKTKGKHFKGYIPRARYRKENILNTRPATSTFEPTQSKIVGQSTSLCIKKRHMHFRRIVFTKTFFKRRIKWDVMIRALRQKKADVQGQSQSQSFPSLSLE